MKLILCVILVLLLYVAYQVRKIYSLLKSDVDPEYFKNLLTHDEYEKAKKFALASKNISTSKIQSQFGWGYSKSARVIDRLEEDDLLEIHSTRNK